MFFVPLSRVTFAYLPLFSPESTAKSIDFSSRNEGKKINDRIKALLIYRDDLFPIYTAGIAFLIRVGPRSIQEAKNSFVRQIDL